MNDQFAVLERRISALSRQLVRLSTFVETSPGVRSIYVGENTVLTVLADGRKMYVDSRDISISSRLMSRGIWEAANTREIRRLVGPGHCAIDIGANCGYFSVLFSSLVGAEGRVFAFEPNPLAYSLLVRSLEVNGFLQSGIARTFSCALGDQSGTGRLAFKEGNTGGGSLYFTDSTILRDNLASIEVEIRRLDEVPIPRDRPTFIKIDAEGAEFLILKGAQRTLEDIDDVVILLEFFPLMIEKHSPIDGYLDFLASFGFSFFRVNGQQLTMVSKAELLNVPNIYVFLARRDISS